MDLVIRADASPAMSTGHVMRCLALAQAWQDAGGIAHFVAAEVPEGTASRLVAENMTLHKIKVSAGGLADAENVTRLADDLAATWIVVDGYHFDTAYQRRVREPGRKLLVIDDMAHLSHYYADVLLNQNIHAESLHYSCEPGTRLLLGTRYVLLRREFLKWREWERTIPEVAHKVLVTLGGGDPDNVALKVIQALQQIEVDGTEAVVVVGPGNPHHTELAAAVHGSCIPIRLEMNPVDMTDSFAKADVGVSGGGSTCWELAFLCLPSALLVLSENQNTVAAGMDAAGAAISLGHHAVVSTDSLCEILASLMRSPERRARMAEKGRALVDGHGARRVVAEMNGTAMLLEPVKAEDCHLIWEWANDPVTRAQSFASEPIPWDEHVRWFDARLRDPGCLFLKGVDSSGQAIGQIRFEIKGDEALVSVALSPDKRGRGQAVHLIRKGTQKALSETQIRLIHAYIKTDNTASIRVFFGAGYKLAGETEIGGSRALHFVLRRREETNAVAC